MKKHFAFLLTAAILAQTTPIFGATALTSFTDYNKNLGYGQLSTHWAKTNIETLLNHNGINGYPEGDFRANKEISAAELIAIILNVTENADDLTGDSWSEKIMNRAYELEICKETEIPLTEANNPISREKMAVVLVNCAEKLNKEDTVSLKLIDHTTIADLNQANVLYQNAIVKAYSMGLLAGTGLNYAPKSSTTRAEATAIVNRLMGYVERVDAKKAEQERLAAQQKAEAAKKAEQERLAAEKAKQQAQQQAQQQQQTQTSVTPTTFDTPSNTGKVGITVEDFEAGRRGGSLDLSGAVGVVNDPSKQQTMYGG